jgi:hypothetical protein
MSTYLNKKRERERKTETVLRDYFMSKIVTHKKPPLRWKNERRENLVER